MRKLACGLMIAISFSALLQSVNVGPVQGDIDVKYVQVERKWFVGCDLLKGDSIGISFRPDNDWSLDPGPEGTGWNACRLPPDENGTVFQYVKVFRVNVTNPVGCLTVIDVYLIVSHPNQGASAISVFPSYYSVVNNGGIVMNESYPRIEWLGSANVIVLGNAPVKGRYNVACMLSPQIVWDAYFDPRTGQIVPWPHPASPPPILRLYRANFWPRVVATADVALDPLNFRKNGEWLTVYIEFPDGYDVGGIEVTTVMVNDSVEAEPRRSLIGDYDGDAIPDLIARFNKTTVCRLVPPRSIEVGYVVLTITGRFRYALRFEGNDVIQVRMPSDLNIDGKVDVSDVAFASAAFGSYFGHSRWKSVADENEDGKVDVLDVALISHEYGRTYF